MATEQQAEAAIKKLKAMIEAAENSNHAVVAAAAGLDSLAVLKRLTQAIDGLIAESDGVAGLHLNGNLAPWDEITAGGSFEEWLLPLEDARIAIAKSEELS